MTRTLSMDASAMISPCGLYRYELTRRWDSVLPWFVVIGLNPSTADATQDDPTIRRCVTFARDHGCGGLVMLNLYAYRATSPSALFEAKDPIGGPQTDHVLSCWADEALVRHAVAAWGNFPVTNRALHVLKMFRSLECLGKNISGSPKHPLYVPAYRRVTQWRSLD